MFKDSSFRLYRFFSMCPRALLLLLWVLATNAQRTEKEILRDLKKDPDEVASWFQLGILREERQAFKDSEQAFMKAAMLKPDMWTVHHRLGEVRENQNDTSGAAEAFENAYRLIPTRKVALVAFADALIRDNRSEEAHAEWGLWLFGGDAGNASKWPVSYAMDLDTLTQEGYAKKVKVEEKVFMEDCDIAETELDHEEANVLPVALRTMRALANNTQWVIARDMEIALARGQEYQKQDSKWGNAKEWKEQTFEFRDNFYYHGAVWYYSWKKVMERGMIFKAMGRNFSSIVPPGEDAPVLLVLGVGLGEMCVFAVSAGMRCVGMDALCNSNIMFGRRIVNALNLTNWINLKCGDPLTVKGIYGVNMVWVNDAFWPKPKKEKMEYVLANDLRAGTVVVMSREDASQGYLEFMPWEDRVRVATSWAPFPYGNARFEFGLRKKYRLEHKVIEL